MINMRPLSELYRLLLGVTEEDNPGGLCLKMVKAHALGMFDEGEHEKLYRDFISQKPNIFSKFWWHRSYENSVFWWTLNEAGKQQRIKFIKHLIQKHENTEKQKD